MPFEIIRNDLTKVHVDAIVNAANTSLLGGSGVDGAIHRAAGPELLAECRTLGGCETGQVKITQAYRLPAKYVIHTVGPIWQGGSENEDKLLADCYRNALTLAHAYKLESIAFPLISSGAYGFPKERALQIATAMIGEFLLQHEMNIYLVVYDKTSFGLSEKRMTSIKQYIDDHYVEAHPYARSARLQELPLAEESDQLYHPAQKSEFMRKRKLEDVVKQLDETFSQRLLRLIEERGMTDAEAYKRANVDRKLFSKIRSDIAYKPSKQTVIAFAIALQLNLDETKDLLLKAGYALSNSSKFDVIIYFFIEEGNYNLLEINEALFAFDQHLLGM